MKDICLDLSECNGLGDLICATPAIKKISEAYNKKILVVSKMPEVFKNNPYVERSIKVSSIDMGYVKENYIVHNSFYNVGKKNERGIEYKHNTIDIRQFHAINLGFMLGRDEMECYYKPTEEDKTDNYGLGLKSTSGTRKYVLIHPVSTWPSRTWAAENWMNLTKELNNKGYKVVSIGKDSSETGFFNVKKPVFNFEIEDGWNLMNKTSISDCWYLMQHAAAFVTMDSGLLHLAGTTDVPIIHLGSSIKPEFRIPYRGNRQGYKYDYVRGGCGLECASNMKYGVKTWGNIQGVQPLIECCENKESYECHPSVKQVLDILIETI